MKYEATLQYYDEARNILNTFKFENSVQKRIWELHCEGLTEREISVQVGTYKKSMVHHIISKIAQLIKRASRD